jgi:predicted AlkP superfamily phosphohydrolase/phosphomutase
LIGLDSLPLTLIDEMGSKLPFLSGLRKGGKLQAWRSCDPPITIPAWTVMTTGCDPGELGVYGFQRRLSRRDYKMGFNTSESVLKERMWDKFPQGAKSFVWGVPQTAPHSAREGHLEGGCILNSATGANFVVPHQYVSEISSLLGEPRLFDISGYRGSDLMGMVKHLHQMLEAKDRLLRWAIPRGFDFVMMVLIETDRLHHAFWHHTFKSHPRFVMDSEFSSVLPDFYQKLDTMLRHWFCLAKDYNYAPILMSDHGVRPLQGIFCLNEWLIMRGYLALKDPGYRGLVEAEHIDFQRTLVYAQGGYCGRLWLNLVGRDPDGILQEPSLFLNQLRTELTEQLQTMNIKLDWLEPEKIYRRVSGIAPDVIVYFGDLDYRASSGVYSHELVYAQNDTGPDGVNHDLFGVIGSEDFEDLPENILSFSSWHRGISCV